MRKLEINPFKYLNFLRINNLFKILISYWSSKISGKVYLWGMPVSISVEPTNICNLHCPECPTGNGSLSRPSGIMSLEKFKEIIDQLPGETFYLQLFFQGEPLINRDLFNMVGYARKKNIYTSVSSNGQLIEKFLEEIISNPPDKLILSIDGIDDKSFSSYRKGGSFSNSEKGLKLLSERKKKLNKKLPFIEFQLIVMKQNEHLMKDVKKYALKNGADKVVFKTMQVSSYESAVHFLPLNDRFSRYRTVNKEIKIKNKLRNGCFALWRTAVITWDGRIVPCCFDKNADYQVGLLNGKSIREVWHSGSYNSFREKVLLNRKSINICTNCTSGMKINI